MKTLKFIIPIAGLLMASTMVHSQTIYEANRFSGNDLNGTARFVGMGGAMGALGGDISTMGTNPAGIGIYRSNDVNLSFGLSNVGYKAQNGTHSLSGDKFHGSFDNVGFVLSLKQGNYTPIRYVNFGFNYRKVKSFDRDLSVGATMNSSQTQQFAQLMEDNRNYYGESINPDALLSDGAYNYDDIPWLAPLAYQSNLISLVDGAYVPYIWDYHSVNSLYNSRERGGIHSYDFNASININDRVYLGATFGVYSIDYRRSSSYTETFLDNGVNDGNYTLNNDYEVDGTGIDFKLGIIFRPIESSPLRIGAAITTPTYYNISEYQGTSLGYDTFDDYTGQFRNGVVEPYNEFGRSPYSSLSDYSLITPWKFNLSLGYTIGSSLALGAEYEYMDYSSSKLKYDDGVNMAYENDLIKTGLKGSSAIRLGAEFKLAPEFSLRVGYNHITSTVHSDSYKNLPVYSVRTDTEYFNGRATNNYTLGFGYRGAHFYADMAYKYQNQKEDFFAFFHSDNPTPTKITNDRHQVLLTLGMRF